MSDRRLQHTILDGHDVVYNYATVSARHLDEMQSFIDELMQSGKLTDHETYLKYMRNADFALPEELRDAKSMIVIALYTRPMQAEFNVHGAVRDVLIPPQYYEMDLPADAATTLIRTKILASDEPRLERMRHAHLKLLAVRSGLARYGRNNISYVEGMGSFITLYAFVTDLELPDEWTDLGMMSECEDCTICYDNCPTGAIRKDEFAIDAGRCLPLYNEVPGDFPDWIPAGAHNAYVGCMRCQLPCPGNRSVVDDVGRLPDLTEEETQALLAGEPGAEELVSAGEKLRIDLSSEDVLSTISRNLRVLLLAD